MAINSMRELVNKIAESETTEDILAVYVDIAEQIDARDGGVYDEVFCQMGKSHERTRQWFMDALPEFDTFYAKWNEFKESEQRRRDTIETVLMFGAALAGGFAIQMLKEVRNGLRPWL